MFSAANCQTLAHNKIADKLQKVDMIGLHN